MSAVNVPLLAFNRGLVSKYALARTDLKRMALSAETQTNWIPRTIGAMSLRPGTEYVNTITVTSQPKHIPFIFSVNDTAILQFGDSSLWVLVNEARITRTAVGSVITNGTFAGNIAGWTSIDQAGATSAFTTAIGGINAMGLTGTGSNFAGRYQQVTVAGGDIGKEHGLRIVILRGPVTIRVGSSLGSQDYVPEATLETGTYSLAFTPAGNFFVQFTGIAVGLSAVQSVAIEGAGVMALPSPYAAADLPLLRSDQSADVVFISANSANNVGYAPTKVVRFGTRSWGIETLDFTDGPFANENFTKTTLTPAALSGDTTVTASQKIFKTTDVGRLIRIASVGQTVQNTLGALDAETDSLQVSGVGTGRTLQIGITGTFVGTMKLRYSVGAPGAWVLSTGGTGTSSFTAPGNYQFDDGFDNQIIFYEIQMTAYTSGSAVVTIQFPVGTINGVALITAVTSETVVSVRTKKNFGGLASSANWWLGLWSDTSGWPTACRFAQGRLWFVGRDYIVGSVSGAFESFDETITGNSAAIIEQLGSGPVDKINWIIATQRIVFGAESREIVARSSSINEPLTPTDFNLVTTSTMTSAPVDAVQVDTDIFFVQGARQHIVNMNYTPSYFGLDYKSTRATEIDPDIGLDHSGFTLLCVQRKPNTRIHCVLADGQVAIYTYDDAEEIKCWTMFEFADGLGQVVDAFVLPGGDGDIEDKVYYAVKLTIDGSTVYWLVRHDKLNELCPGENNGLSQVVDAGILPSAAPASSQKGTITGWINPVGMRTELTSTLCSGQSITFTSNFDNIASDVYGGLNIFISNQGFDSPDPNEKILLGKMNISFTFRDLFAANGTQVQQISISAANTLNATATYINMPTTGFPLAFTWDFTGNNWTAAIYMGDPASGTWTQIDAFYAIRVNGVDTAALPAVVNSPLDPDFSFFVSTTNPNFGSTRDLLFNLGCGTANYPTLPLADPLTGANGNMWDPCEYAQWWFGFGQSVNMSLIANARLFWDDISTPKWAPKNLGTDGSTATGTAPPFYFRRGLEATFVNDGSAGGELTLQSTTTANDSMAPTAAAAASTIPPTSTAYQALGVRFGINNGAAEIFPTVVAGTHFCGLDHLDGIPVVVFGNGTSVDNSDGTVATFTPSGGCIDVPSPISGVSIGLGFTAQFKSTKLAYGAQMGTALTQMKRITAVGVILHCSHPRGLLMGRDFSHLQPMPLVYKGAPIDPNVTIDWDDIPWTFAGTWDTDSRLVLQAASPRPVTLLAAIIEMDETDKQ